MGKIKKILENELVGGTQTTDVYPITSTKAIYDENNVRLDTILKPATKESVGLMSPEDKNNIELVQAEMARKLDKDSVVQEPGNSEELVMSQKAVSDKLKGLSTEIIYDVSARNDGAVFESLQALLSSSNLSTLIPTSVRHGGMSIRFVQSSDNKYVQYRLIANTFSTTVTDWQGVDDEPTTGSNNLVKSGGVADSINKLKNAGYLYAGIATPSTNPGTPDGPVFYIANGKGTYTNFGGINVTEDEVVILYYDNIWHKESTGIAFNDKLTELEHQINGYASVIIFEDDALSVSAYGNVNIDTRFQNAFEIGTTYIFLASTDTILQFLFDKWQDVARSNGNEVEFQYTSSLQSATKVRIINKSDVTSLDVLIKSKITANGLVYDINEAKQKIQENINDINYLTTSFEAQRVQLNTISTKVEKNTIEVEEVAEIVKGKDHSKVIFEQDLEITKAYGNVLLTDLLSLFKVGNKYSCVVGNGVAQLRYNTGSWVTINRFDEQEFEFEWTDTMATATALQFYSREAEAKTFNLKIVEVGTKTKGLEERVNEEVSKIKALFPKVEGRSLYLEGASFADFNIGYKGDDSSNKGNGWFELACERLGFVPLNKARSGSSIVDFARGLSGNEDAQGHKVNVPWTDEEFEQFDILCIMHVHNQNVADTSVLKESYDGTEPFLNTPLKGTASVGYICTNLISEYYPQAYDYVLKEYAKKCYACKDKVGSRWYGTKMGKPFKVICCTHWHDARTTFNSSIRQLQKKWGFELCEFDKHIGFTKDSVYPATGEQMSILFCDNGSADTEIIDGITYGWHPTRGKNAYVQKLMASIFTDSIKPILNDADYTK